ncbi:flagellar basal body P-ring protein FlgI [Leptolyngbya sp. 15MV]|nr:flagellar basal body P-ring protein FlgI [Leptolyngbya sp. 15MV]
MRLAPFRPFTESPDTRGKEAPLARPLLEFYRNQGNPLGSIEELKNAKNVALVAITCTIPASGARVDDTFTVSVQAIHNASSLAGGELFLAALQGPYTTGPASEVFAIAQGRIVIEDRGNPRVGVVRGGARMIRDIVTTPQMGESFTLILRPEFAGFAAASEVAGRIRDEYTGRRLRDPSDMTPSVATVIDDRTIRVEIPGPERSSPASFIGGVMRTTVNPSLLGLPARVIANQSAGIIVMTGDVEISPVAITQRELAITTTIPEPAPTPDNPMVRTDRWAAVSTGTRAADRAKLNDLLEAFNQLRIPVSEQIAILTMLERAGKLHAQLILQ